jgi:hypothetical protein
LTLPARRALKLDHDRAASGLRSDFERRLREAHALYDDRQGRLREEMRAAREDEVSDCCRLALAPVETSIGTPHPAISAGMCMLMRVPAYPATLSLLLACVRRSGRWTSRRASTRARS